MQSDNTTIESVQFHTYKEYRGRKGKIKPVTANQAVLMFALSDFT